MTEASRAIALADAGRALVVAAEAIARRAEILDGPHGTGQELLGAVNLAVRLRGDLGNGRAGRTGFR